MAGTNNYGDGDGDGDGDGELASGRSCVNVNQCWPMWANSNTVMAHASLDKRIHIQPLQILISVILILILVPFPILIIILKKDSLVD